MCAHVCRRRSADGTHFKSLGPCPLLPLSSCASCLWRLCLLGPRGSSWVTQGCLLGYSRSIDKGRYPVKGRKRTSGLRGIAPRSQSGRCVHDYETSLATKRPTTTMARAKPEEALPEPLRVWLQPSPRFSAHAIVAPIYFAQAFFQEVKLHGLAQKSAGPK